MVDLVTALSPHFIRPYLFGAFALVDAGRPDLSVKLLRARLSGRIPTEWGFPAYLGYFAYQYGSGSKKQNDLAAARWYEKAAAIPGSPAYLPRLAAVLSGKGGRAREGGHHVGSGVLRRATSTRGRRPSTGSSASCPTDKAARMKALAPLYDTMPKDEFEALIAELFKGYE